MKLYRLLAEKKDIDLAIDFIKKECNGQLYSSVLELSVFDILSFEENLRFVGALIHSGIKFDNEFALDSAVLREDIDLVLFLTNNGANVDHKSNRVRQLLFEAMRKKCFNTAKLLMQLGGVDSSILFHFIGDYQTMKFLIENGADVNVMNGDKRPLVFSAIREGEPQLVELILNKGINIEQKISGKTSLMCSCLWQTKDNYEMTKLLLLNGADAKAQDNQGNTAAHIAIESNNLEALKALIENDSESFSIVNKAGKTPLMIAEEKADTKAIRLIKREPSYWYVPQFVEDYLWG